MSKFSNFRPQLIFNELGELDVILNSARSSTYIRFTFLSLAFGTYLVYKAKLYPNVQKYTLGFMLFTTGFFGYKTTKIISKLAVKQNGMDVVIEKMNLGGFGHPIKTQIDYSNIEQIKQVSTSSVYRIDYLKRSRFYKQYKYDHAFFMYDHVQDVNALKLLALKKPITATNIMNIKDLQKVQFSIKKIFF